MGKVQRAVWESVRIINGRLESEVVEVYEKLANLIASYGGRVHGSQSDFIKTEDSGEFHIITVYFQIPIFSKEEFEKEYNHE